MRKEPIREFRPILNKSGEKLDSTGNEPALAYDNSNTRLIMFSDESWLKIILGWLKTLTKVLGLTLVFAALIYSILASSTMFYTFVDGKGTMVARGTFLGGVPEPGVNVLASSSTPATDNILNKLIIGWTGVPGAQVMTVVSGPFDTYSSTGSTVTITGEENVTLNAPLLTETGEITTVGETKLMNQYLAQCVAGDCQRGAVYVLSPDYIHGEAK